MNVRVHIRGLCLFRRPSHDGKIVAWLPDADKEKQHQDGRVARPHLAYLQVATDAVATPPGPTTDGWINIPLNRNELVMRAERATATKWRAAEVADLTEFTEGLVFAPTMYAARVEFQGGEFLSELSEAAGSWMFNDSLKPNHNYAPRALSEGVNWQLRDVPALEITGLGATISVTQASLTKGCEVRIGNLCAPVTTWDRPPVERCDEPCCEDDDFRWYYDLFLSPDTPLSQRVSRHRTRSLPVPIFQRHHPDAEGIFVTGCTQALL